MKYLSQTKRIDAFRITDVRVRMDGQTVGYDIQLANDGWRTVPEFIVDSRQTPPQIGDYFILGSPEIVKPKAAFESDFHEDPNQVDDTDAGG